MLTSASISLYFGLGMLLLVPGAPGEPYWARERLLYGAIPVLAGLSLATICGRLAFQEPDTHDLLKHIGRYWLYAVCGIPAVLLLLWLNDLWFHIAIP